MTDEHNPIALIVEDIQAQWLKQVSPRKDIKLIRWLINEQDIKLCEGFLRLENTSHGKVPEGIHLLFTPFEDRANFSWNLLCHFIEGIEKDEVSLQMLQQSGESLLSTLQQIKASVEDNEFADKSLLKAVEAFRQTLPQKDMHLIIALMPQFVKSNKEMLRWLEALLENNIPKDISFLLMDNANAPVYAKISKYRTDVVYDFTVPMDVEGAMQQILSASSDTSGPQAFVALIMKMGKDTANNDESALEKTAEQALNIARQQQNFGMMATVFIIHAGYVFSFWNFKKMKDLLTQGMPYVQKGLELNDPACPPLLVQYHAYNYLIAVYAKKPQEAIHHALLQAEAALQCNLDVQAVAAYANAAEQARYNDSKQFQFLLAKAYQTGMALNPEEKGFSQLILVAARLHEQLVANKQTEEAKSIDKEMTALYDSEWQTRAKDMSDHFMKVRDEQKEQLLAAQ